MTTLWFAGALLLAGQDALWVEGENATSSSVDRNPWYDSVIKEQLSGGAWLSHFSAREGSATYEVASTAAKDVVLWVRANPVASALAVRVNDGAWVDVDFKQARDQRNIAADEKNDLRYLAWVKAGPAKLLAGKNTVSFKMRSPVSNHGGLDCFVLAPEAYVPKGKVRPGESRPAPEVPALAEDSYKRWVEYIRPAAGEDLWRRLEWRTELADAAREARELNRPVLLWAMNGHPCGHT